VLAWTCWVVASPRPHPDRAPSAQWRWHSGAMRMVPPGQSFVWQEHPRTPGVYGIEVRDARDEPLLLNKKIVVDPPGSPLTSRLSRFVLRGSSAAGAVSAYGPTS